MGTVKVEKTAYKGWEDAVRISNGTVELIVLTAAGPRILRYGYIGKANQLCNVEEQMGKSGSDKWYIYGGHRLWHSPEDERRTYEPENRPVAWEVIDGGIRTKQPVEPWAQIEKQMEITLSPDGSDVHIRHKAINHGAWEVCFSIWALSVMDAGGLEIVPQSQRQTGLLSNRLLSLWSYAKMNDPRVKWGERYIMLRQDESVPGTFKFGITNEDGWAAYFNHDQLFIKRYAHQAGAPYPDGGVSFETYTNDFMLEIETLSPLTALKSGDCAVHDEHWQLFDQVVRPALDEAAIDNALAPYISN